MSLCLQCHGRSGHAFQRRSGRRWKSITRKTAPPATSRRRLARRDPGADQKHCRRMRTIPGNKENEIFVTMEDRSVLSSVSLLGITASAQVNGADTDDQLRLKQIGEERCGLPEPCPVGSWREWRPVRQFIRPCQAIPHAEEAALVDRPGHKHRRNSTAHSGPESSASMTGEFLLGRDWGAS
jgi:hypothetical protein